MKIIEGKNFKDLTTFHIGGKIKYFVEVSNIDEINEALDFAEKNSLPIFIIGGGSDFLANDNEFEGLVIKYVGNAYKIDGEFITGDAGMDWDNLVKIAVENNLQGLECLSGIPGTVGASPIQNIGAYGSELSSTFYKLEAFDLSGREVVTFTKDECNFGYRDSIFKTKECWQRFVILNVTFKLNKDGKGKINYESLKGVISENPTLQEIRDGVLQVRRERLENPKEHGNVGSFFKNPIIDSTMKDKLLKKYSDAKIYPFEGKFKVFAGWLIENAGLKGEELGGAAVSPKHALILINKTGNATADEVYKLSEMIINEVDKKFGIKLEREAQLINF